VVLPIAHILVEKAAHIWLIAHILAAHKLPAHIWLIAHILAAHNLVGYTLASLKDSDMVVVEIEHMLAVQERAVRMMLLRQAPCKQVVHKLASQQAACMLIELVPMVRKRLPGKPVLGHFVAWHSPGHCQILELPRTLATLESSAVGLLIPWPGVWLEA
jgi:hypothetical protein